MKTTQAFLVFVVVMSSIVTIFLAMYEIPQTPMDWVLSEVILGVIIYINYLVIAATFSPSKANYTPFSPRKEAN